MCFKKVFSVGVVLLFSLASSCSPTTITDPGRESTLPKLPKPEIVFTEQVVCPVEQDPQIVLESAEADAAIYYTIVDIRWRESEEKLYTKPISITKEIQSHFTLKAKAKKEGFQDSDLLIQEYDFPEMSEPMDDPNAEKPEWNKPHIGDLNIIGSVPDWEFYEKLNVKITVKVVSNTGKKATYSTIPKSKEWSLELESALCKGDKVYVSAEAQNNIINYGKNYTREPMRIIVWQNYYFLEYGSAEL